ncbi:hypothetical protein IPA_06555 [Ignicoccus pacificus DSM 13166]|uniref:Uncharacterized protein n=1 Tax=Ignicoccus pacificus DSM 13166 TaxID=940294 RepID=A0A977KCW3_9CREN|nr:hypothetical protein IPA_06555 [Ignicoccus pacificus DSM 13166]
MKVMAYVEGCLDKVLLEQLLRKSCRTDQYYVEIQITGGGEAPMRQALDEISNNIGKYVIIAIDSDDMPREKVKTFENMLSEAGIEIIKKEEIDKTNKTITLYRVNVTKDSSVNVILLQWHPTAEGILWRALYESKGCEEVLPPRCCVNEMF